MIEAAHSAGAKVLLDGAQAVSHMRVDVQDLNPDWFVFSGRSIRAYRDRRPVWEGSIAE